MKKNVNDFMVVNHVSRCLLVKVGGKFVDPISGERLGFDAKHIGEGTVYGFTNGKDVWLTPEGLNPNTSVHEYTHIWSKAVRENNAELWQSVVENMRKTKVWDEVLNDENYPDATEENVES
ncbi:MAG: hypothetical protein Q4D14_06895 [Bacteroidales bacterium]|nr:hypothetical protein [Bacteroidales bacterium]